MTSLGLNLWNVADVISVWHVNVNSGALRIARDQRRIKPSDWSKENSVDFVYEASKSS